MATLTPNIRLKKPAGSEYPKISDAVNDNADILDTNIAKLQEGIAIIVGGDTASVAVPVGGYAYIKNNTHELTDGLYKNTSSSVFPVTGGTANSAVFTAVPSGAVNDAVSAINNKIGNTALPTTAQTLTGAIAEHEQDIASQNDNIAKLEVLTITFPAFSSLPQTVSNAAIETDMVCLQSVLSNPPAQTGDWTVNTDTAGQVTVSGSISGSTTLTLYLMKSRT